MPGERIRRQSGEEAPVTMCTVKRCLGIVVGGPSLQGLQAFVLSPFFTSVLSALSQGEHGNEALANPTPDIHFR